MCVGVGVGVGRGSIATMIVRGRGAGEEGFPIPPKIPAALVGNLSWAMRRSSAQASAFTRARACAQRCIYYYCAPLRTIIE